MCGHSTKGGIIIDRLDMAILNLLQNKLGAATKMAAATQEQIYGELNTSKSTLHRRLVTLVGIGYVSRGVSEFKSKTYYITAEGITELEEVFK